MDAVRLQGADRRFEQTDLVVDIRTTIRGKSDVPVGLVFTSAELVYRQEILMIGDEGGIEADI